MSTVTSSHPKRLRGTVQSNRMVHTVSVSVGRTIFHKKLRRYFRRDKNFLADKIIKLLKDENLRQTMGEAGKKRFEEEFSFDKFKERLKEVLCS